MDGLKRFRKNKASTEESTFTKRQGEEFTTTSNATTNMSPMEAAQKRLQEEKDDKFAKMVAKMLQLNPWYHGLMPREEIEEMLIEDGDFLVRRTEVGKRTRLAVSVKNRGRIRHILFTLCDGKWSLRNLKMGSLTGLIVEHLKTGTPVQADGTCLVRPVPRPDYYILHDHVEVREKIGGGAFGDVHIGLLKNTDSCVEEVAVKKLKGQMTKKERAIFMREAKVMRRLNHPNIVNLLGVAQQEDPVMIVLELCPNGSLSARLKSNPGIPITKLFAYSVDASRGMAYLSLQKIIHRDIAARNCLIGKKDEIKISDFGLSIADTNVISVAKLRQMPVRWLAPETLRKGEFSTKTDVWSFGVMLWEIFTRCKTEPYPGLSNAQARLKILSRELPMSAPPGCPSIIVAVIMMCFTQDTEQRPDFVEIFKIVAPSESVPIATAFEQGAPEA